jgi:hypothetical protein
VKITASFIPTESGPPHINFLVDLEGGVDKDLTQEGVADMFGKAILTALIQGGFSMIHKIQTPTNTDNGDLLPLCPDVADTPTR